MIRLPLAAALVSLLPALASAQVHAEVRERAADRREVVQGGRELRDDRRDARRFDRLLAAFDDARARGNRRALLAVENETLRELDREVAEARAELLRSRGEVREAKHEVRDDRLDGRGERRDDRRDLRDDRRDVRDDRLDLRRAEAARAELARLRGRMDRRALDRTRALLVEVNGMAWAELREDRGELREDRRELREDRRN